MHDKFLPMHLGMTGREPSVNFQNSCELPSLPSSRLQGVRIACSTVNVAIEDRLSMAKKKPPSPKIKPWPGSAFSLKMKWEKEGFGGDNHFWVHLERRAPGRFGRLQLMHAIVPTRKRLDRVDKFFASARYRKSLYATAIKTMELAGVPEEERGLLLAMMAKEYPIPTAEELYLESLENPTIVKALGNRKKELSYFRTGIPEATKDDLKLVEQCFADLIEKMKKGPDASARMLELLTRTNSGRLSW